MWSTTQVDNKKERQKEHIFQESVVLSHWQNTRKFPPTFKSEIFQSITFPINHISTLIAERQHRGMKIATSYHLSQFVQWAFKCSIWKYSIWNFQFGNCSNILFGNWSNISKIEVKEWTLTWEPTSFLSPKKRHQRCI